MVGFNKFLNYSFFFFIHSVYAVRIDRFAYFNRIISIQPHTLFENNFSIFINWYIKIIALWLEYTKIDSNGCTMHCVFLDGNKNKEKKQQKIVKQILSDFNCLKFISNFPSFLVHILIHFHSDKWQWLPVQTVFFLKNQKQQTNKVFID